MPRRLQNAFTLIETIAAMVVLSIIATIASVLIGQMSVAVRDRSVQGQLHNEASIVLDRLVREVRSLDSVDAGNGFVPDIRSASKTSLQWGEGRLIELSDNAVQLNTNGINTDPLVTDVSAFSLDYLDDDGASLLSGTTVTPGNLEKIRRVRIGLTLSRGGISETLHTLVFLRAMMNMSS